MRSIIIKNIIFYRNNLTKKPQKIINIIKFAGKLNYQIDNKIIYLTFFCSRKKIAYNSCLRNFYS